MAMYVWDRFTMSLVLMYSRPTCGQRDGAGVSRPCTPASRGRGGWWRLLVREKMAVTGQRRLRLQPRLAGGGGGRRSALCPHAVPGKRPAPAASVSRAARAGRRRGPAAGCVRPAPPPAAGAPPWCPGGTAVRRRHRCPPPTGRGSGDRAGAGSEVAVTAPAPRSGSAPSPCSPETRARPGPPAGR